MSLFRKKITPVIPDVAPSIDSAHIAIIIFFIIFIIGITLGYLFARYKRRGIELPPSSIDPFFMPHDWRLCTQRLYQDLYNAQEQICIASYWLTHLNIINALRLARKRKVSVEVVFDESTPNVTHLQQQFKSCGIKFVESNTARMHHKFIVIDNFITWTGSANLTGTAFSKNYENMLRIESIEIAHKYRADFKNLIRELRRPAQATQKVPSFLNFHTLAKKQRAAINHRSTKPISEYQKKVLGDFGIEWQTLNYDQAYAMINKVINSSWRLIMKKQSY